MDRCPELAPAVASNLAKAEKEVTPDRSAREGRVLVAGSINTDLVVNVKQAPAAGETVTGQGFAIFGGGKGANQTLASVRSGAPTGILGAVGDDDFGRQRLADLKAEQVDCSGIAVSAGAPSGVALIIVESGGENRIAYVPGASLTVTVDQATGAFAKFNPDVVLTTLELPREALTALIGAAKTAGATVIVNSTPEPSQGRDLAARADVLIANETEACELLGLPVGDHDWGELAIRLLSFGPHAIVITLGSKGALLKTERETAAIPAPKVDVVDTTGAGDAFCGAFAAALARGCSLTEAATIGVAAGAVAVAKQGAQPSMPTLAEIERLLRKD
jgi:ribokinase